MALEHRHERRVPCELRVALYRSGKRIGTALTRDISNEGAHILTDTPLRRNEIVEIVFVDDVSLPGWPLSERAIVTHTGDGHAGLWFGNPPGGDPAA